MSAESWVSEPRDAPPESLDELVERLRENRAQAGSPSFSEITRRVGEVRAGRGAHPRERSVGRMTVYDCFRLGRRRIDVPLVLDIVRALGAGEAEAERWREWCARLVQQPPPSLPPVRLGEPAAVQPLVGRGEALRSAVSGTSPVAVVGMPGSGKSQLAVHAMTSLRRAGRIREIVSVDLRDDARDDDVGAREVADAVARAISRPVDAGLGADEFLSAVAAAVGELGAGLLLDDAADLTAIEPFVRVLTVPVVVVCRTHVEPRPWLRVVEAKPWDAPDTEAYLRERIGHARCDAEPEAARGLAEGTGGLPLAADLLVARIRQRPGWLLADHLAELRERRDRPPGALEASIELSYAALDPGARRAIRILAVAPSSGLDAGAVAVLLDVEATVAREHLRALRAAQLVEHETPVTLHPVIRASASARSAEEDAPSERLRAVDRLTDLFLERAWEATAVRYPAAFALSRDPGRAVRSLGPEEESEFWRTQLGILLDLSADVAERRPEVPVEVSEAVFHHLDAEGRYRTAEHLHRLALRCAERLDDARAVAACAHRVAQSLVRMGSPYARSELLRTQQLAQQADDSALVLKASNTLAILAAQEGDSDEAVLRFSQALEAAERGGLTDMLAALHDNLGIMLRRAGDLEGARARHLLARRLATEHGDEVLAARVLGNLSDVEIAIGDFASAAGSAREALRLNAGLAGLQHAYARTNLALALAGLGDLEGAEEHHLAALESAQRMGEVALVAAVRNNVGELWLRAQRHDDAAAAFAAALQDAERDRVAHEQARALAGLGECALQTGDHAGARARLSAAAELFGDTASPESERVRELLGTLQG